MRKIDDVMVTRLTDEVASRIRGAMLYSLDKHGPLTEDVVRASLILTEEIGEVANRALDLTRPVNANSPILSFQIREMLMSELAQVASTAMLMLANLQAEEKEELSAKRT